MAFDEQLAMRARSILGGRTGILERRMFGGFAFKLDDRMFVCIIGQDLIVRLGPHVALDVPHLRPMDFTGRPLKGISFVSPAGTQTDDLRSWLGIAMLFVATLPTKHERRG